MKIAPRIVSAALAFAAIVGLPLAQPAHAAGAPDVVPESASPAYQSFGQIVAIPGGEAPDGKAYVRVYFRITNYGGDNSGPILVVPTCTYDGKNIAPQPAYTIPSLPSGHTNLQWFDCKWRTGEGIPDSATIKVRGNNELPEQLKNNTASKSFTYYGPGAGQ